MAQSLSYARAAGLDRVVAAKKMRAGAICCWCDTPLSQPHTSGRKQCPTPSASLNRLVTHKLFRARGMANEMDRLRIEYGRQCGCAVILASPVASPNRIKHFESRGTKDFHGALYEYLRNADMNANTWALNHADQPRSQFTYNNFGFAVGGPVWAPKVPVLDKLRNRFFFFVNEDWIIFHQSLQQLMAVPTALMRQGNFSELLSSSTAVNPFRAMVPRRVVGRRGDVNLPSAEGIFRQILYGNEYFRHDFGKASNEYMLPDCFGFPASLPSILAHAEVKGFSTQKLGASWQPAPIAGKPNSPERTPDGIPFNVGVWIEPDGKSVIADSECWPRPRSYPRACACRSPRLGPGLSRRYERGAFQSPAAAGPGLAVPESWHQALSRRRRA